MDGFLKKYQIKKATHEKPITHTSMKGGKWSIPENKLDEFYTKVNDFIDQGGTPPPLVEKMNDYFPFIIDIDLKYKHELNSRQYNEETLEELINFLWSKITDCIVINDISGKGLVYVMEKEQPYPCNKQDFKTKDGIHLAFPEIIVDKKVFKKIIHLIQEENKIKEIFDESCEIGPDNEDKQILDSSFSSWQLYGCGKEGESPYQLTRVYGFDEDEYPEEIDQELFQEYYTNNVSIMKSMSMCYRASDNVEYSEVITKTLKNTTSSSSNSSNCLSGNMNNDDIYASYYVDNNNIINPFKIVEEEELKLVKGLVKCLSKERAEDYAKWFNVALCLHNINDGLLEDWKGFSSQASSYNPNECDQKWNSINSNHNGEKLGMGSLKWWAKNDNEGEYKRALKNSLKIQIERSIDKGPDAHHCLALVIEKYYRDQFICVDINDDWYFFNGVRWKKTMKGNELKKRIHDEIYNIYHEYAKEYKNKRENSEEGSRDFKYYDESHSRCTEFQNKLLRENYVNTIIGALRHIFYIEGIMEKFDTDNNLIGFEDGIYDLKHNVFREGRPEDYVTLSTRVELNIEAKDMPIQLDDMVEKISEIDNYNQYHSDMMDFIQKIVPIPAVRNYVTRFLSKCLSGENRDEGFYIWTGSGGNGKSKLIDLMCMCLGEYACNLPIALLTQKRKASGAASPEMAITRGKRLCVMQEPDVNETLNVGQMKEITGNDKIQTRGLYKEPFEFTPQFKLLCMCNDLPNIPSNDDGTWRRIEVPDFIANFVDFQKDVDPKLHRYMKDKSIKNKIPRWVIPFYTILFKEWREYDIHGIDIPEEVKAKTSEYRCNNDLVGQWISLNCAEEDNEVSTDGITETAPTSFDTLYEHFIEWCEDEEFKNRPDKKRVREALKKWQAKSKYGLSYGKKKSDSVGMANGYESAMKFNLKVLE